MTLYKAMTDSPAESEVSVFTTFVARLMSLQKQLDKHQHTDTFLRDRLVTSVDVQAIQSTLQDISTRSSHQAVNRVQN